jgi:hypothetical protein
MNAFLMDNGTPAEKRDTKTSEPKFLPCALPRPAEIREISLLAASPGEFPQPKVRKRRIFRENRPVSAEKRGISLLTALLRLTPNAPRPTFVPYEPNQESIPGFALNMNLVGILSC